MKSPWKAIQPMLPDREYLVLASSIPPRSRTSTRALFAGASAVRQQLAEAEGLIGFSLLARPMRKQYATLSVWEDERERRIAPARMSPLRPPRTSHDPMGGAEIARTMRSR